DRPGGGGRPGNPQDCPRDPRPHGARLARPRRRRLDLHERRPFAAKGLKPTDIPSQGERFELDSEPPQQVLHYGLAFLPAVSAAVLSAACSVLATIPTAGRPPPRAYITPPLRRALAI